MNNTVHRIFIIFLVSLGVLSLSAILFRNIDYYRLADEERPFHPRYEELKPSCIESHGYGILGSAMIIIGVATYSSRKRIRALRMVGSIRYFLEFHIFLCLVGPMLVLYHTTFKFGGIVAVSFWSMSAVALSGILGRYLYVQIPKSLQGDELTAGEVSERIDTLRRSLMDQYGLSAADVERIDALASPGGRGTMSFVTLVAFFLVGDMTLRPQLKRIVRQLHGYAAHPEESRRIVQLAKERIMLLRRLRLLEQVKHYFHYWHVIHLPFSLIMFIILFVHVGVAITFGYTWIF